MVETKYDSYYERDVPYKMTLEDLYERALAASGPLERNPNYIHFREEDVLAYFRHRGAENVRVLMYTAPPQDLTDIGWLFGIPGMTMVSGGRDHKAVCKLYTGGDRGKSSSYNPVEIEESVIPRDGSWYCAYKIMFTPVEYEGVIESRYVSDFVTGLCEGHYEIWESELQTEEAI